jgi:hypothetical protein
MDQVSRGNGDAIADNFTPRQPMTTLQLLLRYTPQRASKYRYACLSADERGEGA